MIQLKSISIKYILSLVFIFYFAVNVNSQTDTYNIFYTHRGNPSEWMAHRNNDIAFYDQIYREAARLLDQRMEKVGSIRSEEDLNNYKGQLKEKIFRGLKYFEKTPLNARVTGKLEKENFTVEKIVFESHPGFYVTGCLFIPKERQNPAPAIIFCSGHTDIAFRGESYQFVLLNLVEKGFIVFAFDPIGQGERLQYFDEKINRSVIGGSAAEHSYAGAQCLLMGISLADYFIWDGVRAVDYLLTRPEIDTDRLGITGRSGGGTQTAMIAAYDDRILAAAPECYITSYGRLFQSIYMQDAEQNFYNGLKKNFDHADYFYLRGTKPSLLITTTNDFFSIQGARETYSEVRSLYSKLGLNGNITMVEDVGVHESTIKNRESLYSFFQKHLDLPGDAGEVIIKPLTAEELRVTSTGQVATAFKSRTVFDLNLSIYKKENKIPVLTDNQLMENIPLLQKKILDISGYDSGKVIKSVVFTGKILEDNLLLEKYFIEIKGEEFAIPFVLLKPESEFKSANNVILYLHPEGPDILLDKSTEIVNDFIKEGYAVLIPDFSKISLFNDQHRIFKGSVTDSYRPVIAANLTGKSIVGMWAEIIDLVVKYIGSEITLQNNNITAIAKGNLCPALLHYAVLNKNPFRKVKLINPLLSYQNLISTEIYEPSHIEATVPGALLNYDIPLLEALLVPTSLEITDPVLANGEFANDREIARELDIVINQYKKADKSENFMIYLTKE